jgi:hypothetical protein
MMEWREGQRELSLVHRAGEDVEPGSERGSTAAV